MLDGQVAAAVVIVGVVGLLVAPPGTVLAPPTTADFEASALQRILSELDHNKVGGCWSCISRPKCRPLMPSS
jgi:hypothetical protein